MAELKVSSRSYEIKGVNSFIGLVTFRFLIFTISQESWIWGLVNGL
jgi:hypothetical protein